MALGTATVRCKNCFTLNRIPGTGITVRCGKCKEEMVIPGKARIFTPGEPIFEEPKPRKPLSQQMAGRLLGLRFLFSTAMSVLMFWGAVNLLAGHAPHELYKPVPLKEALAQGNQNVCGWDSKPISAVLVQQMPGFKDYSVTCRSSVGSESTALTSIYE